MSIISGQISYIDDAFGSVYAQVEDDIASQVSGINGPRSGCWSVSTRNSRSSEIDDRTPTLWDGSAVGSDARSQAQRKQSALDGSLLRKLAAGTLQEKAQMAQLAQVPEFVSASVVSKHSVRATPTVAQEKPKAFFVPPNIKPRQTIDRSQCEPAHQPAHATVQHPPPTPQSVKHETVPRAALAGPAKDSRAQRKVQIKGRAGQEIALDFPALLTVPMATSAVPAPVVGHSPIPAPAPAPVPRAALPSSRHATPKPALNAARPDTSGGVIEKQHKDRQEVERDRARVAMTAAKALMSGVLPSPAKSNPYKPNTPPKHAWVESAHSSSKDSGVGFGGLWEDAPPASTHSRQSKHSIAASAKSFQDVVKQITANSNASQSVPQAVQASVKEIAASNGEKPKPPSLQGSALLNMFEPTPSRSVHSMQKSEASRKSLWDAVKQVSTNSELEKASNGGCGNAMQHGGSQIRSASHRHHGWEGIAPSSRHDTKASNGRCDDAVQHTGSQVGSTRPSDHDRKGNALPHKHSTAASNAVARDDAIQRASSNGMSARHSDNGWENDLPASRHSTVASEGDWKDVNQHPSPEVKSARHSNKDWENEFRSVKRSTKASNAEWEEAGFGGIFEETAVSHHSSHKSRASNNLAEVVRHINVNSDHEKASHGDRTHGNVSQNASSTADCKLNSGSRKDDAPASRADSGSQKHSTGGFGDAAGFGGIFEEPAASLQSSRASQMSQEELVDAIIQARAGSRQEASNRGWHEIGQGWTQNNGSHRSGAQGPSIAKSGGEEASRDMAGREGRGASAHSGGSSSSSSRRSSRPSRFSIAAPEEGPTVFAGGGWISPHPLSEASMPQERIVLPPDYFKGTANGMVNNVMTYDDWKEVQRSGSVAGGDRTRPGSQRSSCREDHTSHRSGSSGRQHAGRGSSRSQGGSHHTGLTELAAARYQAELDAIVKQSPPASVLKSSQAGVELKMPWD